MVRNPLSSVMLIVLAASLIGLAEAPARLHDRQVRRWIVRAGLGLVHLVVQAAAVVGVALLSIQVAEPVPTRIGFTVSVTLLVALLGGVVSALLMGTYFALANTVRTLRVHGNEAFSAARLNSHKNFLRLHIDPKGRLTVYALGVDRVPRRAAAKSWKPNPDATDDPDGDPEKPWLVPQGPPLRVELVDRIILG
jgi:hypothetical protein